MEKSHDQIAREAIDEAKDQVINAIAETMDLYGVTRSSGNLYGTMYFENKMTLDEMRQKLGMSKPSMSTGVRKLQEIGMVKQTFQRGTRKHTYMAEKNFFQSFVAFFCQKWEREVKMNMEAIATAQKILSEVINSPDVSDEVKNDAKGHNELLENSKTYYRWLERLVASVQSEEIFEFLPLYTEDPSE